MRNLQESLGLSGRVALITGAASGIGRATALALAECGVRTCLCDINRLGLEETLSLLSNPQEHLLIAVDLRDESACQEAVAQTLARFGRLEILVNVAALLIRKDWESYTAAEWQQTLDVNLKSQFFLCQAAVAPMRERGWGRMINFSSHGAYTGGYQGSTVYAISKGGINVLTKSLARQLAPFGVTVNTIAPTAVETPMMRKGMTDAEFAAFLALIPLGRTAEPEEIATAALFLASDWGSYITGHSLDINGGFVMR